MRRLNHSLNRAALAAVAILALLVPASAGAATVVNGDFETGDLSGWQQAKTGCGGWSAYTGSGPFFPPPQGLWAAQSIQDCPYTAILFQDVPLEPGQTHKLSAYVYYSSTEAITVPNPNSLSVEGGFANQQLRFDVVRPGAPLDSVAPGDILATLFASRSGDPELLAPTIYSADISSLAGQTVRLRVANPVREGPMASGVDAVAISSAPALLPPPPPPSNAISRGKLALNKNKGTAKLTINVPGPGVLTAVTKGKKKKIRKATLTATGAGALQVPLNPNGAGKKVLNEKGKLKAQIGVTFTPTGGAANTQTYKVTLKKTLKK